MPKTKKVNFMLDEEVRLKLEQMVPPGERSRVVNQALKKELDNISRKAITEELLQTREKNIHLSTDEIVAELKNNRLRGFE